MILGLLLAGSSALAGHGWMRPGGPKTKCGGPRLCGVCAQEAGFPDACTYELVLDYMIEQGRATNDDLIRVEVGPYPPRGKN